MTIESFIEEVWNYVFPFSESSRWGCEQRGCSTLTLAVTPDRSTTRALPVVTHFIAVYSLDCIRYYSLFRITRL